MINFFKKLFALLFTAKKTISPTPIIPVVIKPIVSPTEPVISNQMKIYNIALAELGTKEAPGSANNPKVVEYLQSVDKSVEEDSVYWCAGFANWAIKKAGFKNSGSLMARSLLKWGSDVAIPMKGDIVVFSRGTDGVSGHVGFLSETPTLNPKTIKVLSGNENNMVCIENFSTSNVLGYRRI